MIGCVKWGYDVQLIENLNQDLEEYDKIVLCLDSGWMDQNIWIPTEQQKQKQEDEILAEFCSFLQSQSRQNILVLSADKCEDLTELYYTYEFSDRIRVAGGNCQHGSLMNFVAQGLLTEQEMFEAILR